MAEIQYGAPPGLSLVLGNDRGLDLTAALYRVRQRGGILLEQGLDGLLEPGEEICIRNCAVLDHLGEPGLQLPVRECAERSGIDQHDARLVERTDQVLATGVVNARLAADRGIDLREQRRRHLDERDAAQVGRGGEPGDIANDAPAEGDDGRVAVGARFDQPVEDERYGVERLAALAVRQADGLDLLAVEAGRQRVEVKRRNDVVADDQAIVAGHVRGQVETTTEQPATDDDRITPFAELYGNGSVYRHRA